MARTEPGRDPQMVKRTSALNLVFALSSIGLLVTLALMIWKDYDRAWKGYQKEFFQTQLAMVKAEKEDQTRLIEGLRREIEVKWSEFKKFATESKLLADLVE